MSWFKRRKKTKITYIHPQTLIRNIIYDSMAKDPEAVANALGLSPISMDVSEMEDRASETRIARMQMLMPLIDNHAEIAGKVTAANYAMNSELSEEAITDEVLNAMSHLFKYVAFSACVSCVSQLVDLGLIEVNDGK